MTDQPHPPAAGDPAAGLPELPPVADLLCFAFYSASHAFTRLYKPLLDELGLTYPQYLVMVALWEEDGQAVGGIGQKLGLESSTLTPLIKRLEGLGLVTRSRDAADERVVRVRLTAAGSALKEKARRIPGCILGATGLEPAEAVRLMREVVRLREAIETGARG
ncbi:MarR family transcriptional regulator [Xanthobacter sp. V3C-3]|uniref:MarR family winged helix-turn-helix transcriptional regulator n=1 Tax=Xanthobacter lutulentifluminis TaxID=3119935 RepID=UPI00372B4175